MVKIQRKFQGGTLAPEEEVRVRKILQDKMGMGYVVAIIGWRDSNHDAFTRNLPAGKVLFYERVPDIVPKRVGYALTTSFVDHSERKRLRKQVHTHPNLFSTGVIKRILRDAAIMSSSSEVPPQPAMEPEMSSTVAAPAVTPEATQGSTGSDEAGEHEREIAFAKAFVIAVDHDHSRSLSKYELGAILRRIFGDRAQPSRFKHLLTAVVAEGNTKAGQYRATDKLLELAMSNEMEPPDPIEKAKWLIARRPSLEERHNRIQSEMRAIQKELERIGKAAELLESLKRL